VSCVGEGVAVGGVAVGGGGESGTGQSGVITDLIVTALGQIKPIVCCLNVK